MRSEVNQQDVTTKNVSHVPRPGQWTVGRATEWLVANPIVAKDKVKFIRTTIAHQIAVAERVLL